MYKEYKKVQLSNKFTKSEMVDAYLLNQGFNEEEIHYILNPPKENPYSKLHDVCACAKYLKTQDPEKTRIHIIADYDADGVTSVSILALALRSIGFQVDYTVPHRIYDGYGLSPALVNRVADKTDILMTCDNGIVALEAIQLAKQKGLTVIITDHHTPNDTLEDVLQTADYVIHPALGNYPFPEISGATVAYKFVQGVMDAYHVDNQELSDYLLQLCAISIVSDVMPVASKGEYACVNENRGLLIRGMELLRTTPNWHFKTMFDMFKLDYKHLDETMIGFYVAPLINAVGRLTNARTAVEMFLATNEQECILQCSLMGYLNEERKELKKEGMQEIHNSLTLSSISSKKILIAKAHVHEGIVGILAGNLSNEYNMPAIVFTECMIQGQKAWKGSARSVEGVNIFDVLTQVKKQDESLIYAFGGHAGAAGITVLADKMDMFEKTLDKILDEMPKIDVTKYYMNVLGSDASKFARELQEVKPFGNGLPKPFIKSNVAITQYDLFYGSNHVKLSNVFHNEFWLYNELENFDADDKNFSRFTKTNDNTNKRMHDYSMSYQEALDGRAERWNAESGFYPVFSLYGEIDYGCMMGRVTSIFSVQDYERVK